jgi:hypothetical protein
VVGCGEGGSEVGQVPRVTMPPTVAQERPVDPVDICTKSGCGLREEVRWIFSVNINFNHISLDKDGNEEFCINPNYIRHIP